MGCVIIQLRHSPNVEEGIQGLKGRVGRFVSPCFYF